MPRSLTFYDNRRKKAYICDPPGVPHVEQREGDGDQDAEAARGDAGDAEEVILPPEPVRRGENELLLPPKVVGVVVVGEPHVQQVVRIQVLQDPPVELAEAGERRGAHPDDEILLLAQLAKARNHGREDDEDLHRQASFFFLFFHSAKNAQIG